MQSISTVFDRTRRHSAESYYYKNQDEAEAEFKYKKHLEHDAERPEPKAYAGFVPNEVLLDKPPADVIVYVFLQYCGKFGIKPTRKLVEKKLAISYGTYRHALSRLRNKDLISKQDDGLYKFKPLAYNCSQNWVSANALINLHRGYWIPIDLLAKDDISNIAKIVYSVIKSITQSTSKISQDFIGSKVGLKRKAVGRAVNELIKARLVSVDPTGIKSAHMYQVFNCKKREGMTMASVTASNKKCDQHDTSKCDQNDTQSINLSINNINKNRGIRDSNDQQTLTVDNSLMFLESIINKARREYAKIKRVANEVEEKQAKVFEELNEVTLNKDIQGMRRCGVDIATMERRKQRIDDKKDKIMKNLIDSDNCIKKYKIKISEGHKIKISELIVSVLPDYKDKKTKKAAHCLMFNSLCLQYHGYTNKKDKYKRAEYTADECLELVTSSIKKRRFSLHPELDVGNNSLQNQANDATLCSDRFEYLN